jgi:thiol-disulfide isomerase/thioredoxin
MRRAVLLCVLLAGGVAVAGCASESGDAEAAGAGDVALVDVASGVALVDDLATVEEETVVLNFWATWCPPCVAEFPMLVDYDAATDSVAVRFVSLDAARDREAVVAFVQNHGVTDPTYLYTGDGDLPSELNPLYPGGAIPVTMVLDGEGTVEYTHVGAISREELERIVARAVADRS